MYGGGNGKGLSVLSLYALDFAQPTLILAPGTLFFVSPAITPMRGNKQSSNVGCKSKTITYSRLACIWQRSKATSGDARLLELSRRQFAAE